MSRHHHLTVLAAAWWLTQDERYAEAAADQLRSWWRANPFLTGVHWTSGIEAGVRLISWAWTRRLLHDWPKVGDLFEHNDDAVRQIGWHQEFLAAFPSRGSSANNHVVAEAAGRLVAACAFPWYAKSARMAPERRGAPGARARRQHLRRRSQPRAGDRLPPLRARARAGGRRGGRRSRPRPLRRRPGHAWRGCSMPPPPIVDATGRPPRQGDGDEGRALVVDDPERDPWAAVLGTGAALLGAPGWWPPVAGGVQAEPARCPRAVPPVTPTAGPATSVRRRGPGGAAFAYPGRPGDLVPVRRRSPRLPVHRGARPRRRPLPGGAARRRRHPRRPRHLLLPRRAGMAAVVPFDGRPQHRRDRRREPVRVGGTVPLERPRPGRPLWPATSASSRCRPGARSTTATCV